jgi:tRNA A-37 threonylcarbamoyl transferase component Bud32
MRKRKKAEPTPRTAFPHVVEKVRNPLAPYFTDRFDSRIQNMVTETEARELYHMFDFSPPTPPRN